MMTNTCGNCLFFRRHQALQPMGVCREKPPLQLMVGQMVNKITNQPEPLIGTYWPQVPDTEWCGSWSPRFSGVDRTLIDISKSDVPMEGQA